jgi:hypothetical protein
MLFFDCSKRKNAEEHILALGVFHSAVLSGTVHRTASSVFSKPGEKKTQKHPSEYAIAISSPSYYDALSILLRPGEDMNSTFQRFKRPGDRGKNMRG